MALEDFGVLDFVGEKVLVGFFLLGLLVNVRDKVSLKSPSLPRLLCFKGTLSFSLSFSSLAYTSITSF